MKIIIDVKPADEENMAILDITTEGNPETFSVMRMMARLLRMFAEEYGRIHHESESINSYLKESEEECQLS
jgi:hypothetical protein